LPLLKPKPVNQKLENDISIKPRREVISHYSAAAGEFFLKKAGGKRLGYIEQPKQDEADSQMRPGRRNEKQCPLETGYLIDYYALGILLSVESFRVVCNMPGKKAECENGYQPQRPRQGRKNQIQGNPDKRSERPRHEGRKSAAQPGCQYLDQFFVQVPAPPYSLEQISVRDTSPTVNYPFLHLAVNSHLPAFCKIVAGDLPF